MSTYQYKYGDRPLDGYTIQRAAGRGGFGEVYYAISDSGRQVALKAIQCSEQIELRGISQCMNLKSPHLVTVFDVKHNDQGRPFVIMEYISGPSLRDLLKESPRGLGSQKAAFLLREIAKGLSFLHECGIVHRDLKPSNIFYENGYVKIGDYGLAKAITADHDLIHTGTIGTAHYMAPELGTGHYDRTIDIYALGVVLYEMLTGRPPFSGQNPIEVFRQHMNVVPPLDDIEESFARTIRRAMAKDPHERYPTAQTASTTSSMPIGFVFITTPIRRLRLHVQGTEVTYLSPNSTRNRALSDRTQLQTAASRLLKPVNNPASSHPGPTPAPY